MGDFPVHNDVINRWGFGQGVADVAVFDRLLGQFLQLAALMRRYNLHSEVRKPQAFVHPFDSDSQIVEFGVTLLRRVGDRNRETGGKGGEKDLRWHGTGVLASVFLWFINFDLESPDGDASSVSLLPIGGDLHVA